jgi:hypothetical protein
MLLQGDYVAVKWVSPLDGISPPYPGQLPPWSFRPVKRQSVAGTGVDLRLPLSGALLKVELPNGC